MASRILTNMAFWQSDRWLRATTSLYVSPERPQPREPYPLWIEAFELWRRAPHFDVVVTMGARESLAYGLLCLMTGRSSKQIMTEVFVDEPRRASPLWRFKIALYRKVVRRALGLLTNSTAEVDTIARRFGVPASKLRYLPMHTNILNPEFCATHEGFVLAAGSTHRDYATLLAAAPAINAPVVIMCSRRERMPDALPANVVVRREAPRDEYLDHLKRCALAVIPLLPTERSTGQVVLLEAMALGKPVVATRAPGIVDHIRDGENGLLVEPLDREGLAMAANRLLADRALAERLARAALADILEFNTIELHAENRLRVIEELWRSHRTTS